jgi:hypothetical protein
MNRYLLTLPVALKREAEALAKEQKISLNQFILWAVAEKVGALRADKAAQRPDSPGDERQALEELVELLKDEQAGELA